MEVQQDCTTSLDGYDVGIEGLGEQILSSMPGTTSVNIPEPLPLLVYGNETLTHS
jgi:hypothetical protein